MLDYNEFDKLMMHCEYLQNRNSLPWYMSKVLKKNGCWITADGKDEPYCSYDRYTYELTNDQITDISRTYNSMIEQKEAYKEKRKK